MKPGRRKECQGGIDPAKRREPTVEHGNVIKDVQYCSRRLERDPLLFEIVVDNVSGQENGDRISVLSEGCAGTSHGCRAVGHLRRLP